MSEITVYRTPVLTLDQSATAGGGLIDVVKLTDHAAAIRRAKVEVWRAAAKEMQERAENCGRLLARDNGIRQTLAKVWATQQAMYAALMTEADARAAQIEEGG